jgi:hypothetical protein
VKRWQFIVIAAVALFALSVVVGLILYAGGDKAQPIHTTTVATTP